MVCWEAKYVRGLGGVGGLRGEMLTSTWPHKKRIWTLGEESMWKVRLLFSFHLLFSWSIQRGRSRHHGNVRAQRSLNRGWTPVTVSITLPWWRRDCQSPFSTKAAGQTGWPVQSCKYTCNTEFMCNKLHIGLSCFLFRSLHVYFSCVVSLWWFSWYSSNQSEV